MKTKIGYGNRDDIAKSIADGILDAGDIIPVKDTEELIFIRPDNSQMVLKSRTQEEITVKGVTGLGIENNSVIPAGKSLDEIVTLFVQKTIPAKYVQPTISVFNDAMQRTKVVEVGTIITPKFQAVFSQNDAGSLSKLEILQGEVSAGESTSSPYTYTGSPVIISDETLSFTARATYAEGEIKDNNLDQPSPEGHIETGSVDSESYEILGKRNLFYGTGAGTIPELTSTVIRDLTNKTLNPEPGLIFDLSLAKGEQYAVIAYPATLRDISQITYIETSDSSMVRMFSQSLVDVADARGGENGLMSYKVYTFTMSVPAAADMTFKVTI